VDWQQTSAINGPIERYVLYLSTNADDDDSLGEVVYNSTQLLLFHTVNNLTAATLYFVRLEVSLYSMTD